MASNAVHRAVNWNRLTDEYTLEFWDMNTSQFWLEKEIDLSMDVPVWNRMSEAEKRTYEEVLAGLTLLDTKQAQRGMPLIALHIDDEQRGAVLSFMGAMEHIHAKSYSSIFSTVCSPMRIDQLFEWVQTQPNLQYKAQRVSCFYESLFQPTVTDEALYQAMVASVLLESFLFYSGFFYPLYLAGQGKMVASGEIINLIIRDESVHGQYVGLLAQERFDAMDAPTRDRLQAWANKLLLELYENELVYTEAIYGELQLVDEVKAFLRYNANKAFDNLGFDHLFPDEEINPVVEQGLSTETKHHDFFSVKGNGYVKALNVRPVTDATFDIPELETDLLAEIEALEDEAEIQNESL